MADQPSKKRTEPQGDGGGVLVRGLLGFLDRNLGRFSPAVQNTIGLGVLFVFVVYVLNGFIAPTYIRGSLYVRESKSVGKNPAEAYTVTTRDAETATNKWGRWMLPLYRSGLPAKIKIEVFRPTSDPKDRLVGQTAVYGPWPVWSAISPLEYDIEIRPYEADEEKRIHIQRARGDDLLTALARYLEWSRADAQQESRPPITTPRSSSRPSGSLLETKPSLPGGARPAPDPPPLRLIPIYALELRSVTVVRYPKLFTRNGRVYFTITVNGEQLRESDLLWDPELRRDAGPVFFKPFFLGLSSPLPRSLRFPVQSITESWVPVRVGETERFEGLIANVTRALSFSTEPSAGTARFTVHPRGRISMDLWADNNSLVASFDVTSVISLPNKFHELGSKQAEAAVEIIPTAGWLAQSPMNTRASQDLVDASRR